MPLSSSDKASILSLKKQILGYKAQIQTLKEQKKQRNLYYAGAIKSASTPASKAQHKKAKLDAAAGYDRQIEARKDQIESAKSRIAQIKN